MASFTSSTFTAGAVPVKNAKGELSMQKVKVTRYVAGKRPEYAPSDDSSGDEDEQELDQGFTAGDDDEKRRDYDDDADQSNQLVDQNVSDAPSAASDDADKQRRLARLLKTRESSSESDDDQNQIGKRYDRTVRNTAARAVSKPEIISGLPANDVTSPLKGQRVICAAQILPDSHDLDDDDADEANERQRVRRMLRHRVDAQPEEGERRTLAATVKMVSDVAIKPLDFTGPNRTVRPPVLLSSHDTSRQHAKLLEMAADESPTDEDDSDVDDDEEEEDTTRPRLKPVFVRRKDRVTRQEQEQQERQKKQEKMQLEEDRRKEARRMVEQAVRRDIEEQQQREVKNAALRTDAAVPDLPVIDETGDEEVEYEAWRVRELGRIKRDRDAREKWRAEQAELERLRDMSSEDRQRELASKPKQIINQAEKGKMRFLQRYYHRGVFYLDKEEQVLKRDVTAPTLEDQFDRVAMPRVLQVKNFGKSGRSKWTHLAAEDTTRPDAAWSEATQLNKRFASEKAGGFKQERPSSDRRKRD